MVLFVVAVVVVAKGHNPWWKKETPSSFFGSRMMYLWSGRRFSHESHKHTSTALHWEQRRTPQQTTNNQQQQQVMTTFAAAAETLRPTTTTATATSKTRRKRAKSSLMMPFHSYLSFGTQSASMIGCFLVLYGLVLVCLLPMLQAPPEEGPLRGAHLPHQPRQFQEAVGTLKAKFQQLRRGSGVTDASLLNEAVAHFELIRSRRQAALNQYDTVHNKLRPNLDRLIQHNHHIRHNNNNNNAVVEHDTTSAALSSSKSPGVIVLGMHRSGTSMLSGLLVNGVGYKVGGPLIGAAFDNEKGFFERVDVVLQNDEFFKAQRIWWAAGVKEYDADKAYQHYQDGTVTFQQGRVGLAFLDNPDNAPYLQKDPRMCITLPTWLRILHHTPAVIFTYRHPLEVAKSLLKREQGFSLERGLRLWIVYNMRAIQNSAKLCRVLSSNDRILENPLQEVQRIADEVTSQCGVPAPPNRLTQDQVDRFVDPNLQHNKRQLQKEQLTKRVLKDYDGCLIREYDSTVTNTHQKEREQTLYMTAMTIYCDLESGKAYKPNYQWPELP